jgi:hypothetical protein
VLFASVNVGSFALVLPLPLVARFIGLFLHESAA